jgi:hypothetical protein
LNVFIKLELPGGEGVAGQTFQTGTKSGNQTLDFGSTHKVRDVAYISFGFFFFFFKKNKKLFLLFRAGFLL